MKKTLICLFVFSFYFLFSPFAAQAIYVERIPITEVQPNGDTIHFFATGDECYHRYHDANGFTLLLSPSGYWVYAQPTADGKSIEPSRHVYPVDNPATLGLTPGLTISRQEWNELKAAWEVPADQLPKPTKTSGRNHGDYCNLVIFIRFADDSAYTRQFSSINQMFTDSSSYTANSLYTYFRRASYDKIFMRTHYAPQPIGDSIISYQAPHPRNYYKPYSESNPEGYRSNQRAAREFDLIQGAIDYINAYHPIPANVNLDCNGDGLIDNVNFIVKGTYTGWSDLLWPHKWNLYGRNCYINGKQVSTFNLQLEGSGAQYFGSSTFCHEMFHSLGAPDLYRYNSSNTTTPVGGWDLMASNSRPPQHMSAYMKMKYGNWIDSIPTISQPGTYTLYPIADSTCHQCCYRIMSPDEDQYYVLEYRNTDRPFEIGLPGKGLIVYRVDTRFDGNASNNDIDIADEIWVFRPGSSSSFEEGSLGRAAFSADSRRTEFSAAQDCGPFLTDGTRDMHFSITNISYCHDSITFRYSTKTTPVDLAAQRVTTITASLKWTGGSNAYRLRYRVAGSNETYRYVLATRPSFTITGLEENTLYEWSVRSLYGDNATQTYTDSSVYAATAEFHTELCNNPQTVDIGTNTDNERTGVPFVSNSTYSYSQQIFTPEEVGGAKHISIISLHYAYQNPLQRSNCTIYLAQTQLDEFGSDTLTHIEGSELTRVYTGSITFNQGWNQIILDSTFYYDGERNLVVAIDDNSGTPTRAGNKFYVQQTALLYRTVVYHGNDDTNPDPFEDSLSGSRVRQSYRTNIKFTGCPANLSQFYACILPENPAMGLVDGEGYYNAGEVFSIRAYPLYQCTFSHWSDGSDENPRQITITSDTLILAYFNPPVGIDNIYGDAGYVVITRGLDLTLQGAEDSRVRILDLMGRTLLTAPAGHSSPISFTFPSQGVYLLQVGDAKPQKLLITE